MTSVVTYHFRIEDLVGLDIFSFDRLQILARKARNSDLTELAHVMRLSFNGDNKEFKSLLEAFSPESKEEIEAKKIEQSISKLSQIFGGG